MVQPLEGVAENLKPVLEFRQKIEFLRNNHFQLEEFLLENLQKEHFFYVNLFYNEINTI